MLNIEPQTHVLDLRKMNIFIGLGSSIGDAVNIFTSAEKMFEKFDLKIIKKSKIIKSQPQGGVAKNEFSNAVWQIKTDKSPQQLLILLQKIENLHGRTRKKKWEDRTLDLDILIFGSTILDEESLTIPHPEIQNRDFVLMPLSELVDCDFEVPGMGSLRSLINNKSTTIKVQI